MKIAKLKLALVPMLLVLSLMVVPQVWALDIQVRNGAVYFYNTDDVLGRSTPPAQIIKTQDQAEDKADNAQSRDVVRVQTRSYSGSQPIKTISTYEKKRVNIRPEKDRAVVELEVKTQVAPQPSLNRNDFSEAETMTTDQIRMQFSAHMTEKQIQKAQEQRELKKEQLQEKVESGKERLQEKVDDYMQQLRENRRERFDEMVELRSELKDKQQVLELKSRNVKAALKQRTKFSLDPDTNEVTVVTSSGQRQVLNHLPDQAIERMQQAGVLDSSVPADQEAEVEVETNDEDQLVYKRKDKIWRRLFGLFPRAIKSEVVLNDTTGEVIEQEAPANTLIGQFLNAISF